MNVINNILGKKKFSKDKWSRNSERQCKRCNLELLSSEDDYCEKCEEIIEREGKEFKRRRG
jgi:hypothetical protein